MSTLILSSQSLPQLTPYFSTPLQATFADPQTVRAAQLHTADVLLLLEPEITSQIEYLHLLPYNPHQQIFLVVLPEQVVEAKVAIATFTAKQPYCLDYLVAPVTPETLAFRVTQQSKTAETLPRLPRRSQLPQLPDLLSSLDELVWYKDVHGCYQYINHVFLDFFGKVSTDIIGFADEDIWPQRNYAWDLQTDALVLTTHAVQIENRLVNGAKSAGIFQIHKFPIFDQFNQLIGIFGFTKNLTSLKNAEHEVQITIENLPFAACIRDFNGTILHLNQRFKDLYGEAIAIGDNFFNEQLLPFAHLQKRMHETDTEVLRNKKPLTYRESLAWKERKLTIEITKAPLIDLRGEVTRFLLLIVDISQQVAHEQIIRKLAFEDPLTNLANRSGLYEILQADFDTKTFGAIYTLDIINFKRVNERFSYTVGNHLLCEIALRLQRAFPTHFVCRDSDEFILFLTFEERPHSLILAHYAQMIIDTLTVPFELHGTTYALQANLGYVGAPLISPDFSNTIHQSELALQVAKQLPGQAIVDYNKELMAEVRSKEELITAFSQAIMADELELAYQPQYTRDQHLVGFEALLRWPKNPLPQFNIAEIIAIIEKTPLIHQLGLVVLHKAFAFARLINYRRKNPLTVAVNLSAYQVMDSKFITLLEELISEYQIPPTYIDLEITETVLLEDLTAVVLKLDHLQQMGFHISLDDFGTGYSSLNYLAKLPLSKVKIDRSFTMELINNEHYQTVVKMIVAASHALNFKVVAEGVETQHELAILKKFDTDYIQGYYFSKPLGEREALKLA